MESMIVVHAKPLSNNRMWQGRRFKTPDYTAYEQEVAFLLPRDVAAHRVEGLVEVHYRFFIKNHKLSDCDNMIKPLQDILVKRGFIEDDRHIYRFTAEKVPSETPRIEVEIIPYRNKAAA